MMTKHQVDMMPMTVITAQMLQMVEKVATNTAT
jgi:hypothetical protein